MDHVLLNSISAIAIGLIIFVMSLQKSGSVKALIYSLPIPITIALIATDGVINTTNVIGLFLICLFLWSVFFFVKRGINIYVADVIAVAMYIGIGYVAIGLVHASFETMALLFIVAWMAFVTLYRHHPGRKLKRKPNKVSPLLKLPVVTVMAYILFGLKAILGGVIVTFPFSGVFAVIESRDSLRILAALFTRNSIAVLAMFITMHYLVDEQLVVRLLSGLVVYSIVLGLLMRFIKFKA